MINPTIQIELLSAEDDRRILLAGYLGDYPLLSCRWTIEHGADASQVAVSLPGNDLALNDRLLGLKLYNPQPPATNQPESGTSGSAVGGIGKSRLEQERLIIEEAKRQGITNPKQIAYILGTAQHESDQFQTLREYHDGSDYEFRRDLGNKQTGDGTRFRGRGYVQITGRANYEKYSKITGKDLVGNPKLAEDQTTARFILVDGIKRGTFTGVGLDQYTDNSGNVDYYGARRTVNRLDQAEKIAGYARNYEQRLTTGDLKDGSPPTNQPPATGSNQTKVATPVTITPPPTEAGGKLIVRAGEFGGLIYEYLYLLSDVQLSIDSGEGATLSLSGISPVWAINQYTQTNTRSNLTLKQLAAEIAASRGLDLDFKGEGTYYIHLENNGLTGYQLLLRECSRAGYTLWAEGTVLKCHPIAPQTNSSGQKEYSIALSDILSFSLSSKPGGATPGNTGGLTGSWNREAKIQSNTATGSTAQTGLPIGSTQKVTVENKPTQPNLKDAKTTGSVKVVDQNGKAKDLSETAMRAEVSRVMDLPAQVDLISRIEYLGIRPANLVKIPTMIQYSGLIGSTDFWVSAIHFDYSDGTLRQSIDLYKPGVEVPVSQAMSGGGATGTVATGNIPNSAGWTHPYPGATMTAPWGEVRGSRRHAGQDWSTGTNSPLRSAAEGQVVTVTSGCRVGDKDCGGGYGNSVDIISQINGTRWLHRYAHMTTVTVKTGQMVKAGENIGTSGDTGHSYGEHLHFEIRKPDSVYGFGGTIDPKTVGI
jgi:murein DD-endopeptidase MepM/ murein hydrolase activator NlpD